MVKVLPGWKFSKALEYRECYCKATRENRKLLQIGFTIIWVERTMICKDFIFDLHPA